MDVISKSKMRILVVGTFLFAFLFYFGNRIEAIENTKDAIFSNYRFHIAILISLWFTTSIKTLKSNTKS